jgi:toxin CptA
MNLSAPAIVLAALCAGVMGYAIQRGATCTVAAVDELIMKRRPARLIAMLEASLWVAGGLALASVAGLSAAVPGAYPVTPWLFAGAALLGFGAAVNRACVFGAVARFGTGDWNYAATPLGYFAGCVSVQPLFSAPAAQVVSGVSPVLAAAGWVALAFGVYAASRVLPPLLRSARGGNVQRLWTPHAATAVIGVTFVVILLSVGVWAYTDVLAQLAHGMSMRVALGVLCLLALFAGAWLGGRGARRVPPSPPALLRCFAGGVLMAWGSLLIPGSNDGLILVGLPLLRPYAWLAFATMCATIALARWGALRSSHFGHARGRSSSAS